MKVSDSVIQQVNALSPELRARVDEIVRAHIAACRASGILPEHADCLLQEAIDVARYEAANPEPKVDPVPDSPRVCYEQYTSPKEL